MEQGYLKPHEILKFVAIYRHPAANRRLRYLECSRGIWHGAVLANRTGDTRRGHTRFGVIMTDVDRLHRWGPIQLFNKKFLFDQHDRCVRNSTRRNLTGRAAIGALARTACAADLIWPTSLFRPTRAIDKSRRSAGKVGGQDLHRCRGPDLLRWPAHRPAIANQRNDPGVPRWVSRSSLSRRTRPPLLRVRHLVLTKGRSDIQFVLVGDGCRRRSNSWPPTLA